MDTTPLGVETLSVMDRMTIRTRALDAIVRLETLRVLGLTPLDVETLRVLGVTLEENCASRFAEAR